MGGHSCWPNIVTTRCNYMALWQPYMDTMGSSHLSPIGATISSVCLVFTIQLFHGQVFGYGQLFSGSVVPSIFTHTRIFGTTEPLNHRFSEWFRDSFGSVDDNWCAQTEHRPFSVFLINQNTTNGDPTDRTSKIKNDINTTTEKMFLDLLIWIQERKHVDLPTYRRISAASLLISTRILGTSELSQWYSMISFPHPSFLGNMLTGLPRSTMDFLSSKDGAPYGKISCSWDYKTLLIFMTPSAYWLFLMNNQYSSYSPSIQQLVIIAAQCLLFAKHQRIGNAGGFLLSDESDLLTCIIQLGAIYGDLTMSTGDKIGIYTNIYIYMYIYIYVYIYMYIYIYVYVCVKGMEQNV